MKKLLLLTTFFALSSFMLLKAQDIPFTSKYFKGQKEELKFAKNEIKAGDKLMKVKEGPVFGAALKHYMNAYKFNPKNAEINFKVGVCKLYSNDQYSALPYFQEAYELNNNVDKDIHYYLGVGHQLEMDWDNAINHFSQYSALSLNREDQTEALKKLDECQNAMDFIANPARVEVTIMEDEFNSTYSDFGMVFTPDSSEIYFTSRRESSLGGRLHQDDRDNYYENIYYSKKEDSVWTEAENLGPTVNQTSHTGAVAFSPDGQKFIIYIDEGGIGYLYESHRDDDSSWTEPQRIEGDVNSYYHETTAWYSPDGEKLYFISERPEVDAPRPKRKKMYLPYDKNIYVATWDSFSEMWVDVEPLPDNINTEYDEDGLFLTPDGKTLYFSSKGHNSMGGYDVFKSELYEDGTWSDPINLGYPINGPGDDIFFMIDENSMTGYLTSYRTDGKGEKDLYRFRYLPDEEDDDDLLASASNLSGLVRDAETHEPVAAKVKIINTANGEVAYEFFTDDITGTFDLDSLEGEQYLIEVSAEDYLFHSSTITTSDEELLKVGLIIDLNKIVLNETDLKKIAGFDNIYFDLNSSYLRADAIIELDKIVKILNDNPTVSIELGAHTDCRESHTYNQWLSERRAKNSAEYIRERISNGHERISYVGYGETRLTNDCPCDLTDEENRCTEEEHQANRRVEFIIDGKDKGSYR